MARLASLMQRFTRRHAAVLILLLTVGANLYVDYRLFLRNPRELEAQAKRFLRAALPGYTAQFGPKTEFDFFTGKLYLSDVVFHRQGSDKEEDVLFRVPKLIVESDGLIPSKLSIVAIDPYANLEITPEGKLKGLDFGESDPNEEPVTSLPLDLEIEVQGGVVRLKNDFEGIGAQVLVSRLQTVPGRRIYVRKDLSLEGALSLYLGSMVPKTSLSPDQDLPGLPTNMESKTVLPELTVELSRTSGGPFSVVAKGRARVSRAIRGLIPPVFQTEVWDELNPLRGEGELLARVTQSEDQINVDISLTPHLVAMKAKGFPVELVDIDKGRFEISIAVASGDIRFLGVSWEGVTAKISGANPGDPGIGRLLSRGTVYPGREGENVTIHIAAALYDLPLADHLVAAIPVKIREVYDQFQPEGTIPEGHVTISKGPEERDILHYADGRQVRGLIDPAAILEINARGEPVPSSEQPLSIGLDAAIKFKDYKGQELVIPIRDVEWVEQNADPQIAVWIPRLDGQISATYREVPERMEEIEGWFELREGASVRVKAEGRLEHGGRAKVDAQVMAGELISVHVDARNVPIGPHVINAMPGTSKEMVEPFRLEGGEMDVDVRVSKPHMDAPALPVVRAKLRKVGFDHRDASMPLVATGSLEVRPIFKTAEQDSPDRIDVSLDLALEGEGVVAALASGTLSLPPTQPKEGIAFDADLRATIAELRVGALPPLIRDLLEPVRPAGLARGVEARVQSPDALWVKGTGAGLRIRPKAFDLPLEVERFHVEVAEGRVLIRDSLARRILDGAPKGGQLEAHGWIGLGDAESPPVDLSLAFQDVDLEETLIAALPPGTRDALTQLDPTGVFSGKLQLRLGAHEPDVRGSLQVKEASLTLHRIHERLGQLESSPLKEFSGQIGISPERITLEALKAKLAGADLLLHSGDLRLADGELVGFDLPVELRGLEINPETRALAGEAAEEFFQTFYVEGPTELSLRVFKPSPDDDVHFHLEARPRGALVRADFAPVPVSGLTGTARIEDGDPVVLDLVGFLSPPQAAGGTAPADPDAARIRVRREAEREERFPGRGSAGRVYRVSVTHFQRYPLVAGPDQPNSLRERFESRLDPSWRETLDRFDLAGTFDVEAWIYQPHDPREAMRWTTEARFRDGALTLARFEDEPAPRPGERAKGIGFTDLNGVLRLKGRLAELELGSCVGELQLSRADFFKQTFQDFRGPFQIKSGKLSLGIPGQPFRARLYEGDFLGRTDFDFKDGSYACEFALGLGRDVRQGRLAAVMRELDELSEGPKEDDGKAPFAFRGRLSARVSCGGGGADLKGQARPFAGAGQVRLEGSNLLDTPFLKALQTIVAKIRGSDSYEPLPNLAMDFRMNETGLRIRSADLWGKDLKVHGEDGILRYDGYIDLDVVPFDTSGGLHQILKWVPGTGYSYRGSFTDKDGPKINTYLNPLSTIDWFRDLWQGEDKK